MVSLLYEYFSLQDYFNTLIDFYKVWSAAAVGNSFPILSNVYM